jgi:hypothetical protein
VGAGAGVVSAGVEGISTPNTNDQKGEEHMLKKLFVTAAAPNGNVAPRICN